VCLADVGSVVFASLYLGGPTHPTVLYLFTY
jgi:hypothetical protein